MYNSFYMQLFSMYLRFLPRDVSLPLLGQFCLSRVLSFSLAKLFSEIEAEADILFPFYISLDVFISSQGTPIDRDLLTTHLSFPYSYKIFNSKNYKRIEFTLIMGKRVYVSLFISMTNTVKESRVNILESVSEPRGAFLCLSTEPQNRRNG